MSDERRIEELLRDAGGRTAIPEDDLAAIRESARIEWRRRYRGPASGTARRRWWIPIAAAASLALVGLLLVRTRTPKAAPPPAEAVAVVARAAHEGPWKVGARLAAGAEVDTTGNAPRPLSLAMAGGASVRVDAGTRVRIASRSLVELSSGAVYVDTAAGETVAVRAPAGVFHPAGTQFEVRVREGATTLKVREGSVALDGAADSAARAAAGEELVVRTDGSIARRQITRFGPHWEWVLASAPVPEIEGMKVRAFLDWIAREAGWRVEISDAATAALVDSVELHGSVSHLTPQEALSVVLSSAGLEHRISDGALVVSVGRKGGR